MCMPAYVCVCEFGHKIQSDTYTGLSGCILDYVLLLSFPFLSTVERRANEKKDWERVLTLFWLTFARQIVLLQGTMKNGKHKKIREKGNNSI